MGSRFLGKGSGASAEFADAVNLFWWDNVFRNEAAHHGTGHVTAAPETDPKTVSHWARE